MEAPWDMKTFYTKCSGVIFMKILTFTFYVIMISIFSLEIFFTNAFQLTTQLILFSILFPEINILSNHDYQITRSDILFKYSLLYIPQDWLELTL